MRPLTWAVIPEEQSPGFAKERLSNFDRIKSSACIYFSLLFELDGTIEAVISERNDCVLFLRYKSVLQRSIVPEHGAQPERRTFSFVHIHQTIAWIHIFCFVSYCLCPLFIFFEFLYIVHVCFVTLLSSSILEHGLLGEVRSLFIEAFIKNFWYYFATTMDVKQ